MSNFSKHSFQSGDELIVPKSSWNLIQHHAVYLGKGYDGTDWIIENNINDGVRLVTLPIFIRQCGKINNIIPFSGTISERHVLVQKALESVGKPYDLINFNCEHFASELKTGVAFSTQVNTVKAVLGFILLLTAAHYLSTTKRD